jgi:hypothetical protein
MKAARDLTQPSPTDRRNLAAALATFILVQGASCWWGFASEGRYDPREWNPWHATNAALAVCGVATAIWVVLAVRRRRWLVLLAVLPVLVQCEWFLLRWEWTYLIWSRNGFAP